MHMLAMLFQNNQLSPEAIQHILVLVATLIPIIIIISIAIVMIPCWFILKKAGFSPWLCLLCLIPSVGTLVLLYVLAFAEWKVVPTPQAAYPSPFPPPPYPPQA